VVAVKGGDINADAIYGSIPMVASTTHRVLVEMLGRQGGCKTTHREDFAIKNAAPVLLNLFAFGTCRGKCVAERKAREARNERRSEKRFQHIHIYIYIYIYIHGRNEQGQRHCRFGECRD
jgi:hypothetical protein